MRSMKSCKFLTPILFALLLTCAAPLASAQTYTVLHRFTGTQNDGEVPAGTLVHDSAGNLYGTTGGGGSGLCDGGCGTVFVLGKSGRELGAFSFDGKDGASPSAGLFRDRAGNLYGTTNTGGRYKCGERGYCGTVFQLNRTGTKIRYFSFGGGDGEGPIAQPIMFSGTLYGTTQSGGTAGWGTVFAINPQGKETVLHSFEGESDGCGPLSGVTADSKGNLYGVTYSGGSQNCGFGAGVAYEVDTAGNFVTLFTFGGDVGEQPRSTLTFDPQGNLYGTAFGGGSYGEGTVFELSPQNDGTWAGRALYSFCPAFPDCTDGTGPRGGLAADTAGNLYGVTYYGGAYPAGCGGAGCGTIFKVDPSGHETVLHNFTGGSDGGNPGGGLIIDASGNLYGTTYVGGDPSCKSIFGNGCGVVFELTP